MEYLITGRHEIEDLVDGTKQWVQWSPLVRGWFNPNMPDDKQFAWKYAYEDEAGGKHRLTKGYTRVKASDVEGGVKAWVDSLDEGEMFPEPNDGFSPLHQQFVSIEYYRDEQDVVDWVEQTRAQELRVSKGLEEMKKFPQFERQVMNEYFPQHRHSCNYPGKCQFWEICWGSAGTDPFMFGFDWRVPHHQGQREQE